MGNLTWKPYLVSKHSRRSGEQFFKNISLFRWVCIYSIFFFEKFKLFFFLLCVHLLECPVCIIVQNDKVSVAHVESRQVITSIFGIKDVFIDYIGCSSRFWSVSNSDLPNGPVFPKNIIHLLRGDFIRQIPDVEDPIDLWWQPDVGSFSRLHRHGAGITRGLGPERETTAHPETPQSLAGDRKSVV